MYHDVSSRRPAISFRRVLAFLVLYLSTQFIDALDSRLYGSGPADVEQTWVINENVVNFWRPGNASERGGGVPVGVLPQRALLVNGSLPGPPLNLIQGDIVRITVINHLLTDVVTIHWHGLSQRECPWADGSDMVTQCPVEPGGSYTYLFKVDQPGTYFWHAHTGMQMDQGLVGQLVVRPGPTDAPDPHRDLYDDDTLPAVIVQDWWRDSLAMLKAPSYLNFQNLEGALINGFFTPVSQDTSALLPGPPGTTPGPGGTPATTPSPAFNSSPSLTPGSGPSSGKVSNNPSSPGPASAPAPSPSASPTGWAPSSVLLPPLARDTLAWGAGADGRGGWSPYTLRLNAGRCYRLRFINANGEFSGWQVSVVGHTLTLIALDAQPLQPQRVRSFVFYGGNRVDAILCTDRPAGGSFPLVFSSVSQLSTSCPWWPNKCQFRVQALITYPPLEQIGPQFASPPPPGGITLEGGAVWDVLDAQQDRGAWRLLGAPRCVPPPTRSVRMALGFLSQNGPAGTKAFLYSERTPFHLPVSPVLLNGLSCGSTQGLHVEHVNSSEEVLELIMDNLTDMPHPIHMHGGRFAVIDSNFWVEAQWQGDVSGAACPVSDVPMHADTAWLTQNNNMVAYRRFWGCTFGNTSAQRSAWAARPGCEASGAVPALYESDTVVIAPRTWVVLRVHDWNPGMWLVHCHTNHHVLRGMGFLLNVLPSLVPPVPDWLSPTYSTSNASAQASWEAQGYVTAGQCGPPCRQVPGTVGGGLLSYSQFLAQQQGSPSSVPLSGAQDPGLPTASLIGLGLGAGLPLTIIVAVSAACVFIHRRHMRLMLQQEKQFVLGRHGFENGLPGWRPGPLPTVEDPATADAGDPSLRDLCYPTYALASERARSQNGISARDTGSVSFEFAVSSERDPLVLKPVEAGASSHAASPLRSLPVVNQEPNRPEYEYSEHDSLLPGAGGDSGGGGVSSQPEETLGDVERGGVGFVKEVAGVEEEQGLVERSAGSRARLLPPDPDQRTCQ